MPTYVYRREDGTTFEVFQSISEDALTEDPETGQKIERVISGGVGLQFKGTGFYLTDYARPGGNGNDSKESSGDSKPAAESKSETKSDTKNASSSDSTKK